MTAHDEPLYIVWRATTPTTNGQAATNWQYGKSVEGWLGDPAYADHMRQQRAAVRQYVRDTEILADEDRIQTKVLTTKQAEALGF